MEILDRLCKKKSEIYIAAGLSNTENGVFFSKLKTFIGLAT